MTTEHSETCSKKVRGMAQRSLDLIDAMHAAAEAAQPITGRGIGLQAVAPGSCINGEVGDAAGLSPAERGARAGTRASLLARSSKQGWAVVDPATLFNVTVRHHRQMPVGYPGRDEAHPLCGAIRSDVAQSKPRGLS